MDIDRNLLFGLIAVQAELVAPTQLVDACAAWANRRERPLADILQDRGWLTSRDRATVDYLMDRRLKRYGGHVRSALAAAADPSIREALLAAIRDREVHRSIADLPPHHAPTSGISSAPRGRERFTLTSLTTLDAVSQTWIARDEELGREVALKELRPEAARDAQARNRFLQQARLAGQLEHPNILPLYELSQNTTTGIAFCTTRLPRGRSLAEAIQSYHGKRRKGEADPVEFRGLILAFLDLCQAVAFAHARLVVHLDLRPQHVLLGDLGEAVLCDWSRARKLSELLAEVDPSDRKGGAVSAPDSDAAIGTVSQITPYSAPELAEGRFSEIDASTDVYALGAILYEILTGQPPFAEGSEEALRQQIATETPPTPRRLVRGTPAALEAIAMKALSKRRGDRYARAGDLLFDLERWLADEPIQAWSASLVHQATRWMRRNRPVVQAAYAGLAIVFLSLLVLVVVLERGWAEAKRARLAAIEEKNRTEYALMRAQRAIDDYAMQIAHSPMLREGELNALRRRLLEGVAQYHTDAKFYVPSGPEYFEEQAEAYLRLARIYGALDDPEKAISALNDAREALNRLVLEQPRNYTARLKLAYLEGEVGLQWRALGQKEQAIASLRSCVSAYDALPTRVFTSAERICERIAYSADLVELLLEQGSLDEAEQLAQRSHRLAEQTLSDYPESTPALREVVRLKTLLAALAQRRRQPSEAVNLLRQATQTAETLAARDLNYRPLLVQTYLKLGQVLQQVGQSEQAVAALRDALGTSNQLVRGFPMVSGFRADLATVHRALAEALMAAGKLPEAEAEARRAAELYAGLRRDAFPERGYVSETAASWLTLARILRRRGENEEAQRFCQEVLNLAAELKSRTAYPPSLRTRECEAYLLLARLAADRKQFAEAHTALDQAAECDPQAQAAIRAERISVYGLQGQAEQAIKEAQVLAKDSSAPASALLRAAAGLAQAVQRGLPEEQRAAEGLIGDLLAEARRRDGAALVGTWLVIKDDPEMENLRKLPMWQQIERALAFPAAQESSRQP